MKHKQARQLKDDTQEEQHNRKYLVLTPGLGLSAH
jgi:hypothetical protein